MQEEPINGNTESQANSMQKGSELGFQFSNFLGTKPLLRRLKISSRRKKPPYKEEQQPRADES